MVQIIIESMMEKLGNLESLGIVQSDPVDYQSFSMADAETDRNIAQRIAREELLERAGTAGADYLILRPFNSNSGCVTGREQAVGEMYRIKKDN